MPDMRSIPFASVAVLTLVLGQTALMNAALATEPQAAGAPAAAPTATASPAQGAVAAQPPTAVAPDETEESQASALAERQQRYAALRAEAAELGVALPEAPPWETGRFGRPDLSARMRGLSPEERQAAREARWQQMRAEAAERGIEMPETPPWVEAEKRRQEMQERFTQYRRTIEQMSDEQREAARAFFGAPSGMPYPYPSFPPSDAYQPWHPPCHHEPRGMAYPPMMPGYPAPNGGQYPPAPSESRP